MLGVYPFESVLFVASLALFFAALISIADHFLKLLYLIPSPLDALRGLMGLINRKLNRPQRSTSNLRIRATLLLFFIVLCSAYFEHLMGRILIDITWDYTETCLLSLCFLVLRGHPLRQHEDQAGLRREQVERLVFTYIHRVLLVLGGWLLLTWSGVAFALLLSALTEQFLKSSTQRQTAFENYFEKTLNIILIPISFLGYISMWLSSLATSRANSMTGLRSALAHANQPYLAVFHLISETLGFSLNGKAGVYTRILSTDWIGKGSARLTKADIFRTVWLLSLCQMTLAFLLFVSSLAMS